MRRPTSELAHLFRALKAPAAARALPKLADRARAEEYPIDFDRWGRDRLSAARRAIRLVCARTHRCHGDAVLRDLAALATRLRHRPVSFTVAVGSRRFHARLDENAVAQLTFSGGSAVRLGVIPATVASGASGDLAPLRRLAETALLMSAYPVTQHQSTTDGFAQAFATECHDFPRAYSLADTAAARRGAYQRAAAALGPRAFLPFSASAWTSAGFSEGADTCIEWPNDPSAERPIPPGTAMPNVPVLVISGDLDANTTSAAGREVAHQFTHATFAEIPNVGHVPTDTSPCVLQVGLRFVATTTAHPDACAGTGAPPAVTPSAPLRAAGLPPVSARGASLAERRALAVVLATAIDARQQTGLVQAFKAASALRGGRYLARGGRIRLAGARVVRDANVSGELAPTKAAVTGGVHLTGSAIPDGHLHVRLTTTGTGRATGTLDGQPVDLTF